MINRSSGEGALGLQLSASLPGREPLTMMQKSQHHPSSVPECAVLPWVAQTRTGGKRRDFHEAVRLKAGVCFCCRISRHYLPCRKNTNFQMSPLLRHKQTLQVLGHDS